MGACTLLLVDHNPLLEKVFNPLLYRPRNAPIAPASDAVQSLLRGVFELLPWAREEIVGTVELNMRNLSRRPQDRRLNDPDAPRIQWTGTGFGDALRYESWMGSRLLDELQSRDSIPEVCTLLWILDNRVAYDSVPRLTHLRSSTETWAHAKGNCLELAALVGASLSALGHEIEFLVAHNPIGYATKAIPRTAAFHAYAAFTAGQERFLADQHRLVASEDLAGLCAGAARLTPRQYLAHMIGYGAGRLVERGDIDAATRSLERALEVDDQNYTFHTGLGELAAIAGDRRDFLLRFRTASALDPSNGEIDKRKGDLLCEAFDDTSGARRAYRRAIEKGMTNVIVAYDLYRRSQFSGSRDLTDDAARVLRTLAADHSTRCYLVNALVFEHNDQPFGKEVSGRSRSSLRAVYGELLDAALPGLRTEFGL